jgi:hypothetical protein
MQNKPNFMDTQMLVSSVMTKHYGQKKRLTAPAKQTQSNPISNAKNRLLSDFPLGIWGRIGYT